MPTVTLLFTPRTSSWTCPPGVTEVAVRCWGGGGGGRSPDGGAGGGGGGYSEDLALAVTPGTTYAVVAGVGGTGGIWFGADPTDGGDSSFGASTVLAKGGIRGGTTTGGAGGAAASGVGTTKTSGGNGGNSDGTTAGPGAGGGSGGDTTDGGNGGTRAGGGAGTAGAAGTTNGAAGGTAGQTSGTAFRGQSPGGGGGGGAGGGGEVQAGMGGDGRVTLTYEAPNTVVNPSGAPKFPKPLLRR